MACNSIITYTTRSVQHFRTLLQLELLKGKPVRLIDTANGPAVWAAMLARNAKLKSIGEGMNAGAAEWSMCICPRAQAQAQAQAKEVAPMVTDGVAPKIAAADAGVADAGVAALDDAAIAQRMAALELRWKDEKQEVMYGTALSYSRLDDVGALLEEIGVDALTLHMPDLTIDFERSVFGRKRLNCSSRPSNALVSEGFMGDDDQSPPPPPPSPPPPPAVESGAEAPPPPPAVEPGAEAPAAEAAEAAEVQGASDAMNDEPSSSHSPSQPAVTVSSRRREVAKMVGSFFTRNLQMELKLDHRLSMQNGSTVKPKHVKIHDVDGDGFCLLRALYHPDVLSCTEMRCIVRKGVTRSMQTADGFVARIVSLADAISEYMTRVPNQQQIPSWVMDLSTDLMELQEDRDRLWDLANTAPSAPVRGSWDARITDACTRDAGDTSSEEGDGLLLWLAEGDLPYLARELGANIRSWKSRWLQTPASGSNAVSCDVESYVLTHVEELLPTPPATVQHCIDIVHGDGHFDRMFFVQPRFSQLQLDLRKWPLLETRQIEQVHIHLKELAVLLGTVVDREVEETIKDVTGAREVAAGANHWKPRGTGASGPRMSSSSGMSLEPSAKRLRSSTK